MTHPEALSEGPQADAAPPAQLDGAADRSAGSRVREAQRARILAALIRVVCDHGVESTTVAEIIGEARVSRRTFYELFEDRDDCVLAAFDDAVGLIAEHAGSAYLAQNGWVDRTRAGLLAVLELFDGNPQLAELCVVHALRAGPATLCRRRGLCDRLAHVIDQGRDAARSQPPQLTAACLLGGLLEILHARMLEPNGRPLVELLNPLMVVIVLPYRGARAARRELSRPLPSRTARPEQPGKPSPLVRSDMRLTYRTMRVLSAIAARPGLNNSEVGDLAGVANQGQISKLLNRLANLGLIENMSRGSGKTAVKSWRLTVAGEELERSTRLEFHTTPR